jgi:hypothetical protein
MPDKTASRIISSGAIGGMIAQRRQTTCTFDLNQYVPRWIVDIARRSDIALQSMADFAGESI